MQIMTIELSGSSRFGLRFSDTSWLSRFGSVRFGSVRFRVQFRPVPLRFGRFGSVSYAFLQFRIGAHAWSETRRGYSCSGYGPPITWFMRRKKAVREQKQVCPFFFTGSIGTLQRILWTNPVTALWEIPVQIHHRLSVRFGFLFLPRRSSAAISNLGH